MTPEGEQVSQNTDLVLVEADHVTLILNSDWLQVSVQYHADETGFHATGSHVPQAPPMPAHVQRLLDHLAKVNGLERL